MKDCFDDIIEEEMKKSTDEIDPELISLCLDLSGEKYPDEKSVKKEIDCILEKMTQEKKVKKPQKMYSLKKVILIAAVVSVILCTAAVSVTAYYQSEIRDNALIDFILRKTELKNTPPDDNEDRGNNNPYRELFSYSYSLAYSLMTLENSGYENIVLPEITKREKMRSSDTIYFEEKYCKKAEFWQYDETNYVTVRIRNYSRNPDRLPDIENMYPDSARHFSSESIRACVHVQPNGRIMLRYTCGNNYYKISADCTLEEMTEQAKMLCAIE